MVDLGTLGGSTTYAQAVNGSGQVVGDSETGSGARHAFSWTQGGGMVDLGTLGGSESYAVAVNDSGQAVGDSYTTSGAQHAFSSTQAGGMLDLGTLDGSYSQARAVNGSGQVVGDAETGSGFHAVVWTPQTADNSADEQAPAGGTVSTNATTSADDPVGTAVTTPNAGTVSIEEGSTTTQDPSGYSLLGEQIVITAPAATAADPLVLQFLLDASILPAGADPATTQVFRDGAPIADCAADAGTSATPDPCIASRTVNGDGGVALTIRTSHASTWNFGLHTAYPFQGFYSPTAAPPTLNPAQAGSAVSLRFSLGGDQGLGILASGYPRSHRISCDSAATDQGDDSQTAGSLSYDRKSKRYTYAWKTSKTWASRTASTCRQFVLRLNDGSTHKANFRFSTK
jgi:probable HAF family extracellular repeat protein